MNIQNNNRIWSCLSKFLSERLSADLKRIFNEYPNINDTNTNTNIAVSVLFKIRFEAISVWVLNGYHLFKNIRSAYPFAPEG